MSNNVICKKSCKHPTPSTFMDSYLRLGIEWGNTPVLSVCENGFQSTGVDLPLHMYDLLREIVNDYKVVEYYENLRNGLNVSS